MSTTYVIYHFRPLTGGLARRVELLGDALSALGGVRRPASTWQLCRAITAASKDGRVVLMFFSSLALPVIAAVRMIRPDVELCYMVRGDEYTFASHFRRRVRARLAVLFQLGLAALGCRFVFASDDLKEAFEARLGALASAAVLPNTAGVPLPKIRPFDGSVAVVGDFGGVKNVEAVIDGLSSGNYRLDLYGNTHLPPRYRRPWVRAHGKVADLSSCLRQSSVLVLASRSEGSPNVMLDALTAGCAVVAHDDFPFRRLPLAPKWRFSMSRQFRDDGDSDLETVLGRLRSEQRDFKKDNPQLVGLVESDWTRRVKEVFA